MNTKTKKITFFCLGAILVVILFLIFQKPDYPDQQSPKAILGNPDATIKIVEFSDLQCPACKSAHPAVKRIMNEYPDKASLTYKHFPLTNIHLFAFDAAVAAECANDQGKFWEFVDKAFEMQSALQKKNLKQYAADLQLDTEKFNVCMESGTKDKYIRAEMNEGIGKGVQGTPTFFINGKPIEVKTGQYWYEVLKTAIDTALGENK